jgi:hypothetical protein
MSSDNPFEQVEALIASDERQRLPTTVDAILKAIAKVPGAGPLVAAVRYESEKQRIENSELMLKTMWEELKRVSAILDDLWEDPSRRDGARKLVLDATRKAEDLRDSERVKRIGKILAHAITLGPMSNFDKAEEMMRVARDLSDQDVVALSQMYDSQFEAHSRNGWRLDIHQVNVLWREKPPQVPGTVLPGEMNSILLKLQGLGLVIAVERMNTQLGPNEQVFALLPKGADFVRYIEGAVAT